MRASGFFSEVPARDAVASLSHRRAANKCGAAPLPAYDPVTVHPSPFLTIEATAADPINGPHQHIDAMFIMRAADAQIGQLDRREVDDVPSPDPRAADTQSIQWRRARPPVVQRAG